MKNFPLRVLAPERTFFDGACTSLTVPSIDGMQLVCGGALLNIGTASEYAGQAVAVSSDKGGLKLNKISGQKNYHIVIQMLH